MPTDGAAAQVSSDRHDIRAGVVQRAKLLLGLSKVELPGLVELARLLNSEWPQLGMTKTEVIVSIDVRSAALARCDVDEMIRGVGNVNWHGLGLETASLDAILLIADRLGYPQILTRGMTSNLMLGFLVAKRATEIHEAAKRTQDFELTVHLDDFSTYKTYTVNASSTISTLKDQIQDIQQIPRETQQLYLDLADRQQRLLQDGETFWDIGIRTDMLIIDVAIIPVIDLTNIPGSSSSSSAAPHDGGDGGDDDGSSPAPKRRRNQQPIASGSQSSSQRASWKNKAKST